MPWDKAHPKLSKASPARPQLAKKVVEKKEVHEEIIDISSSPEGLQTRRQRRRKAAREAKAKATEDAKAKAKKATDDELFRWKASFWTLLSLIIIVVLFRWILATRDDEEVWDWASMSPEIAHKWGFVVILGITASFLSVSADILTSWNRFYGETFVPTIIFSFMQVAKGTIDQLANPPQWPKGWYAGIAFGSSLLVASAGLASMAYDSAESFAWLILLATIYVLAVNSGLLDSGPLVWWRVYISSRRPSSAWLRWATKITSNRSTSERANSAGGAIDPGTPTSGSGSLGNSTPNSSPAGDRARSSGGRPSKKSAQPKSARK
ncbi:hypothetical protein WJX75_001786 [Coccomyxa subellipsoidea]|uniref:Uncharacterized protein n=1 Tax=Coccomyxa subellipsoidea TaxID=248742 RepID=A0ABR2YBB4_9CHLO